MFTEKIGEDAENNTTAASAGTTTLSYVPLAKDGVVLGKLDDFGTSRVPQ